MKLWKLLLIGVLSVFLLTVLGCGGEKEEPAEEPQEETQMAEPAETTVMAADHTPAGEEIGMEATDPVCGMTVTVEETTPAAEYEGEIYYFCNAADKDSFVANPQMYMGETEEGETPAEESTETEGEGQ